jgi:hypothetical protein
MLFGVIGVGISLYKYFTAGSRAHRMISEFKGNEVNKEWTQE